MILATDGEGRFMKGEARSERDASCGILWQFLQASEFVVARGWSCSLLAQLPWFARSSRYEELLQRLRQRATPEPKAGRERIGRLPGRPH